MAGQPGLVTCALCVALTMWTALQERLPIGTFVAGQFTLTLNADGTHAVSDGGEVVVSGTYVVKDKQITLTDKAGAFACPDIGRYEWSYDGKTLTFQVLVDECDGRVDGLTAQPWTKK